MAEDEDTPMQDTPARTEDESESGSGSGSESEDEGQQEVEWLATTREKRSTAGNRMHNLLQQEEEDDDLELLFAEADDDVGFSDAEADSDVQMDSSDDDEDQGPAAGEDDLEGEKELQKQARAEKAKKRKLDRGMPKGFKKRVKIDPTVIQAPPPPRPKKKSERASWLPTADEAPTRASARGTTKESKQQLHAQMVDREIKRLNQLRQMEKAAKAKEAAKKPVMTQEDRLKEAARVERSNAKSLSRWEEAEQQREEEQLAKLAALKNRVLEGPVITWWSGVGEWVGGKLKQVGKNLIIEEKEKPTKKRKAAELEESETGSVVAGPTKAADKQENATSTEEPAKPSPAPVSKSDEDEKPNSNEAVNKEPSPTIPKEVTPLAAPTHTPTPEMRFPPAVPSPRYIPSPGPPNSSVLAPPPGFPMSGPPYSSVLAPPAGLPLSAPPLPPNALHRPYVISSPAFDGSTPLPGFGTYPPPPPFSVPTPPPPPPVIEQPPAEDLPPKVEHAACNYFILENFDETAIKDKNVQTQIIFGRKFVKAPRSKHSHEVCVITGHPARYRDPNTGLPYYNSYAYKEIQKLKKSEYKWSRLVGAYVGTATYSARGVPERFRNPNAPRPDAVVANPDPSTSTSTGGSTAA
ncbi:hypothetical protein ONS95_006449 [Cadophora gregata]|uniref:uncharacterized protein n=1 Tax=Cadophora gregata TaxID=51156 RepID=UPI0026DC325F|nr:uncharacterized protein ONS95_006449 [Cadophora gregata]KAK0101270.1 hypothetical protein ONS95_006449 [Cadophora gregata]